MVKVRRAKRRKRKNQSKIINQSDKLLLYCRIFDFSCNAISLDY